MSIKINWIPRHKSFWSKQSFKPIQRQNYAKKCRRLCAKMSRHKSLDGASCFKLEKKSCFGFPSSHPPVLTNERTKLWPTANFSSRAKITTVYMTWRARGSRRISGIQTRHLWNVNSANENPIFEMMRIMNNSNILQSFPSALVICLWYKEICFSSFDYRDFWEGSGKSGENNVDEKKKHFQIHISPSLSRRNEIMWKNQ